MVKSKRNLFILILTCLFSLCCLTTLLPNTKAVAKADGEYTFTTIDAVPYKMVNGAQVRYDTPTGLRFVSYIDNSVYETLEASADYNVSYGMLIAPIDYVTENEINEETVFGEGDAQKYYFAGFEGDTTDKKEIINLSNGELFDANGELLEQIRYQEDVTEGAYKCFKGVITNIDNSNYNRGFVGVGYIKFVSKADSSVDYKFVDTTNQEDSARSVEYVAGQTLLNGAYDSTKKETLENFAKRTVKETEILDETIFDLYKKDSAGMGSTGTISDLSMDVEDSNYTVVVAKINGEKVDAEYANGKVVVVKDKFAEVGTYNVEVSLMDDTSISKYEQTVETFTYAIDTVAEFKSWYAFGNTWFTNATVALTADLDLTGSTFSGGASSGQEFTGVFDGKGHVISNFNSARGLFPQLNGTLKNLAMVNMTTTSTGNGFVGYTLKGTIENCYFEGTMTAAKQTGDSARDANGFYAYCDEMKSVSNLVIIVNKTADDKTYAMMDRSKNFNGASAENVYMVNNKLESTSTGFYSPAGLTETNCHYYNDMAGMQGEVTSLPDSFKDSGYWVMVNGMLTMKSVADYCEKQDVVIGLKNQDYSAGIPVTVVNNNYSAKLYINDSYNSTLNSNAGKLMLPADLFTEYGVYDVRLELVNSNEEVEYIYTYSIDVVDYAIGTADEFKSWYNFATEGYKNSKVALTADIDLTGFTGPSTGGASNAFSGVFDGKGHTISNFTGTYGLIPYLTGTLKNVAMVNATITGSYGFVGYACYGTIENCYFEGQMTATSAARYSTGFYSDYEKDDKTDRVKSINNVVVVVNKAKGTERYYGMGKNSETLNATVSNVYMVNNEIEEKTGFYGPGGLTETNCHYYNDMAGLIGEVTSLPDSFKDSGLWTYDATYGITFNSALNYYKSIVA